MGTPPAGPWLSPLPDTTKTRQEMGSHRSELGTPPDRPGGTRRTKPIYRVVE